MHFQLGGVCFIRKRRIFLLLPNGRRLFPKNWRNVFPKCFGGVCFHCEASASNLCIMVIYVYFWDLWIGAFCESFDTLCLFFSLLVLCVFSWVFWYSESASFFGSFGTLCPFLGYFGIMCLFFCLLVLCVFSWVYWYSVSFFGSFGTLRFFLGGSFGTFFGGDFLTLSVIFWVV